jgi:hypothetical protein
MRRSKSVRKTFIRQAAFGPPSLTSTASASRPLPPGAEASTILSTTEKSNLERLEAALQVRDAGKRPLTAVKGTNLHGGRP